MNDKKSPLGVRPGLMVAWIRIGELIDGIERQLESTNGNSKLVQKWAEEIQMQCSIIEAMRDK